MLLVCNTIEMLWTLAHFQRPISQRKLWCVAARLVGGAAGGKGAAICTHDVASHMSFNATLQRVAQRIREVQFEMNEASRQKKLAQAAAVGAQKRPAPSSHHMQVCFNITSMQSNP